MMLPSASFSGRLPLTARWRNACSTATWRRWSTNRMMRSRSSSTCSYSPSVRPSRSRRFGNQITGILSVDNTSGSGSPASSTSHCHPRAVNCRILADLARGREALNTWPGRYRYARSTFAVSSMNTFSAATSSERFTGSNSPTIWRGSSMLIRGAPMDSSSSPTITYASPSAAFVRCNSVAWQSRSLASQMRHASASRSASPSMPVRTPIGDMRSISASTIMSAQFTRARLRRYSNALETPFSGPGGSGGSERR